MLMLPLVALPGLACGGDDDGGTAAGGTTTTAADTDPGESPSQAAQERIDAATLCERLTDDVVGGALGVAVTGGLSDRSTPQCEYEYDAPDGGGFASSFSIAPATLGRGTPEEDFDGLIGLNRQAVGGDPVEVAVEAGDGAVRLSGSVATIGLVNAGGGVVTIILPTDFADAEVDALIVAVAEAME